jgi:hypothetical protein
MSDAYCVEDGCHDPATHERLIGVEMVDVVDDGEQFTETVELVCEAHQ